MECSGSWTPGGAVPSSDDNKAASPLIQGTRGTILFLGREGSKTPEMAGLSEQSWGGWKPPGPSSSTLTDGILASASSLL